MLKNPFIIIHRTNEFFILFLFFYDFLAATALVVSLLALVKSVKTSGMFFDSNLDYMEPFDGKRLTCATLLDVKPFVLLLHA